MRPRPAAIAALVSVGVSAGVFFALFKLLPLFENHLDIIALSGGVTFLFSNLIGLKQTNVQRMLGYSSIAQMGLLMLALALLQRLGATASLPLVVGGLFFNHLFAKAGLFWLAGAVERPRGRRLVGDRRASAGAARARPAAGRHRRPAALPRLLGEVGAGDAALRRETVPRHRRHPRRIASGGGLHVRLVQAGDPLDRD